MNLSIVNPLAISCNLTVAILLSSCINRGKYISFDIKDRVIVLTYLHWLICVFVGAQQPLLAACFLQVLNSLAASGVHVLTAPYIVLTGNRCRRLFINLKSHPVLEFEFEPLLFR